MKKRIVILGGLLAVQLVLAVILSLSGEDYGTFQAEEKLLSFNKRAVNGLQITHGTDSVELRKQEGMWLLPGSGHFPASQHKVEQLLDNLAALEKGWPVARTLGAAQRFTVDSEQFERKLILLSDDNTQAILYVGSSPGFRKVYVRPGDGNDIFAVEFNIWEANATPGDWIDKDILTFDENFVQRIEMPGLILQRQGGELQVVDLDENEQTNAEESRALIGKLAGLRVQSLLGTEAQPEYQQDKPAFEARMTTADGEVLNYRFSRPQDVAYYVLKRSDMDYYFEVAEYTVDPVREANREKLVQARTEEAPGETADDKSDEKDGDARHDDKNESDTGGESSKEDE